MIEFDKSLNEWRCYSENMRWICFSGYGYSKAKAELNYHIKMAEMFINQPKIFADNVV